MGSPDGYKKHRLPTAMNDVIKQINICFKGGSGDISQSSTINIKDQIAKVENVKKSFNDVTSQSLTVADLNKNADTVTTTALTTVTKLIAKDKTVLATEFPGSATSEQNPVVALEVLNKYSNKNVQGTLATGASCTIEDKYVFQEADCGSDYPKATSETDKAGTAKACVLIGQFTDTNFDNRYKTTTTYKCGGTPSTQLASFKAAFQALQKYALNMPIEYTKLKTAAELIKVNAGNAAEYTFYTFNTKLVNQLNSVKAI